MTKSAYDTDLDRNPANFQPLTPLSYLERAAAVFPDHTAIIHGKLRRNYRDFYARSKRLASALAKRGIARGDTGLSHGREGKLSAHRHQSLARRRNDGSARLPHK